ncbi:uncharacterized protein BX663DRAFT_524805 [Cokeromyces recurvatus]|uniref:uncharacterized protein n=1 Tax=Cokeromyces recurvatus TaxID=90255 RepID=UPI0022211BE9|nr:uncharacterized protein BX663DRAFT_524805 [Cokeromyces recurvatus]KAI7898466.1 hypothetical protein BX663DRAFT_524805 [Cokeromyces recurvatus]
MYMSQNMNNKIIEDTSVEESSRHHIQTRRTSTKSTRSTSPIVTEDGSPVTDTNGGRVLTRSQSVESSGYETNSDTKKRKRKTTTTKTNNNHHKKLATNSNNNKDENERETRNTTQRLSKEAKEAKRAQREIIIKERLNELDKLEQAVRDGSHSEYHKLLKEIETKRAKRLNVAKMRRSLAEGNITKFFHSQKYAAYSQFYWEKLALRRYMIQQVQQKINILEQEYYSNHVQTSLDEDHLTEWVPPERPTMISSLTLGLSKEDTENDIEWAKQKEEDSPRKSSPPLDMLASLADRQYQKDFNKQELSLATETSFNLPPLNPWKYDQQRPSLPT